jgi:anti-sigma factor ChrR (cupin superfamily)
MTEIGLNSSTIPWQRAVGFPPGITWKVLRRDMRGRPCTALLKLPQGFSTHSHLHLVSEQHYVLSGAYQSQGRIFGPGSYRSIPKRVRHGPWQSMGGAVVLVIWNDG